MRRPPELGRVDAFEVTFGLGYLKIGEPYR